MPIYSYLNNEVTCCLLYLLEHDLDEKNPVDYGPANIEDDEARVFHRQDFEYEYVVDADIGYRCSDSCDAVYKNLPKKHHVLKKAKKLSILPCKEVPR